MKREGEWDHDEEACIYIDLSCTPKKRKRASENTQPCFTPLFFTIPLPYFKGDWLWLSRRPPLHPADNVPGSVRAGTDPRPRNQDAELLQPQEQESYICDEVPGVQDFDTVPT